MFDWNKKEKPIQGLMGAGGGAAGFLVRGLIGGGSVSATGGAISTDGDYTFHYFTYPNSDSFVFSGSTPLEMDIWVVGGGGGGAAGSPNGGYGGGGGGAGSISYNRVSVSPGTYLISVGAPGSGGDSGSISSGGNAGQGGSSSFGSGSPLPFISYGGGAGKNNASEPSPINGGSGGGAGSAPGGYNRVGGTVVDGNVPSGGVMLGNPGGHSVAPADPYIGGGGGGAWSQGGYGGTSSQWPLYIDNGSGGYGFGRDQLPWIPTNFGYNGQFGGGGAAGGWSDTGPANTQGAIGRADDGGGTGTHGSPVLSNTSGVDGSGGGGAGGQAGPQAGTRGGSGSVLIRYKTTGVAIDDAPQTFASLTSPNSTTIGNTQYHVFTGPGTLTVNSPGKVYYLVVGGGGGGGTNGGGGGAGGVRCNHPSAPALYRDMHLVLSSPQPIVVGPSGSGGPYPTVATPGSQSNIGTLVVASGGGAGGTESTPTPRGGAAGYNGGSGGGGGYESGQFGLSVMSPDSRPVNFQGFPGGWSHSGHYGGGGGSGQAGNRPGTTDGFGKGGNGAPFSGFPGPGLSPLLPAPTRTSWQNAVTASGYFAGGGAGADQNGGPAQPGSLGGGGESAGNSGQAGVNYTGSGGAGSAQGGGTSAPGGIGIVIVAVQV